MVSNVKERERFVIALEREGVPEHVARLVLRHAATLQRLAELQCSSEAYDQDRVRCPGDYAEGLCLCRDYGAFDAEHGAHGRIPRGNVTEFHRQRRMEALLAPYGVTPDFSGDPRGAVVKLKVPSGRTDDWGQTGLCVP